MKFDDTLADAIIAHVEQAAASNRTQAYGSVKNAWTGGVCLCYLIAEVVAPDVITEFEALLASASGYHGNTQVTIEKGGLSIYAAIRKIGLSEGDMYTINDESQSCPRKKTNTWAEVAEALRVEWERPLVGASS